MDKETREKIKKGLQDRLVQGKPCPKCEGVPVYTWYDKRTSESGIRCNSCGLEKSL